MAKLISKDIPYARKEPKYLAFVPVVREFAASGMESALVEIEEGDDVTPRNLAGRLRSAIGSAGLVHEVGVSCVKGETYLRRTVPKGAR